MELLRPFGKPFHCPPNIKRFTMMAMMKEGFRVVERARKEGKKEKCREQETWKLFPISRSVKGFWAFCMSFAAEWRMCKNNATCIDCAKGEVQRSGGNIFTFTGPVVGESRDLVYPFPLALLPPLSIILFAQDAFAFTCLCRIYISKGYRRGVLFLFGCLLRWSDYGWAK